MGWNTFIDPLTDTMCEDCGDFLCEAANEALIRIGGPARDHQIHHLSVIEAVGGEPAALFAFDRYDELFQDDPEHWCHLALSAPEQRLLELLEQHLPRQQRLFDETFYQLTRLLEAAHVIQPWHLLVIALAGWLNRHQQTVIDYLIEEYSRTDHKS